MGMPTEVSRSSHPTASPFRKLGWFQAIALHLAPAVITFVSALLLAPLMARLGLPESFALSLAFIFFLTPIELGLLLRAAHHVTGKWSLRALPSVLAYRRPMGRWAILIPVLFGFALLVAALLGNVSDAIGTQLIGVYPRWMLPVYDPTTTFPASVLVPTLLITLLIDGMINPVVEELYFRAYLLPRIPLGIRFAVPASAALFSLQHYWQPYNWPLIFILELVLTILIVRSRSIQLGIVMHVLGNSFGTLIVLIGVLT